MIRRAQIAGIHGPHLKKRSTTTVLSFRFFFISSLYQEIVKYATEVVGNSYFSSIKNGFNDTKADHLTRISFKYAASRGVYGTPVFYVNGFVLPDTGASVDYNTWIKVIDPLVGAKKGVKNEESVHFFL